MECGITKIKQNNHKMKNNKLTIEVLKKLIKAKAHQILKERNEEEFDDSEDEYSDNDEKYSFDNNGDDERDDSGDSDFKDDLENSFTRLKSKKSKDADTEVIDDNATSPFSDLNDATSNLANIIGKSRVFAADKAIKNALNSGKLGKDFEYNKMVSQEKMKDFSYVVTVLASLYKGESISESEKTKIRNSIWEAMAHPYSFSGEGVEKPTLISRIIARNAGIRDFGLKTGTLDFSYYLDIVSKSLYDAIDSTLDTYDPNRGIASFDYMVIKNAAGRVMTGVQSKSAKTSFSTAVGGKDYIKSASIDEPLGGADEERDETKADRFTGEEGQKSSAQTEREKELSETIQDFVLSRLKSNIKHGGANALSLDIAEMLFKDTSLAEISRVLNISNENVRINKSRMETLISEYIKNGSFQKFIKDKTGIVIKFPDNKYKFALLSKTKPKEENDIEYFQPDKINPATGEPEGEWVQLSQPKAAENSPKDYLGDIAFPKVIEVGEDVKIIGLKALKETNPEKYANVSDKKNYKVVKKDSNEFVETGAEYFYTLIDDSGKEVTIPGEKYLEPVINGEDEEDLGPNDQGLNETFITKQLMKLVNRRILKEAVEKKFFLVNPNYFKDTIVPQEGRTKTHEQILQDLKNDILKNGIQETVVISYALNNYEGDAIFQHTPTDDGNIKYEFTGTAS